MTSLNFMSAKSRQPADSRRFSSPSTGKGAALLCPETVSDERLLPAQRCNAMVLADNDSVAVIRAHSSTQIERALRLRYRVFVEERNGKSGLSNTDTLESDIFDPYCEHLIAVELKTNRVVGTCRLMLPAQAAALGCLPADRAFWLTRLNPIRDQVVEVGRTCLSVEHRNGITIRLLWRALLNLVEMTGQRYAIGAASISLDDGGELAARLARHLSQTCMADEPWRAWPRRRLSMIDHPFDSRKLLTIPPLFKSYLGMGARLLGEPHHDEDFGTADFPVMLDMWSMDRALTGRLARSANARQAALEKARATTTAD